MRGELYQFFERIFCLNIFILSLFLELWRNFPKVVLKLGTKAGIRRFYFTAFKVKSEIYVVNFSVASHTRIMQFLANVSFDHLNSLALPWES